MGQGGHKVGRPSDGLHGEADVVIVGSGMAGLAVAAELGGVTTWTQSCWNQGRMPVTNTHGVFDEETALRMWLEPDSDAFFWRPYRTSGSGLNLALSRTSTRHPPGSAS
jgi:hypothetical protein